MTKLDPISPVAWVGEHDRILLDDRTRFGLRRKVIARKDEAMDVEMWLNSTAMFEAKGCTMFGWLVQKDGYFFLWLVWKDRR